MWIVARLPRLSKRTGKLVCVLLSDAIADLLAKHATAA
jgi:hypothetical protein